MMQLFTILLPSPAYYLLPVCVCETLHWMVMCMCKAMRGGTVQVQLVRVLYRNTAPSFGSKPQNHNTHDRKTQADNISLYWFCFCNTRWLPPSLPSSQVFIYQGTLKCYEFPFVIILVISVIFLVLLGLVLPAYVLYIIYQPKVC